jgi:hypothetical protein
LDSADGLTLPLQDQNDLIYGIVTDNAVEAPIALVAVMLSD